mmetsp:Transcript_47373/g.146145  ORF Transcript_47373/g.146145 Transcript_47373/m.146145 type:complete len:269 (-) Transcript_47373:47-853(-)
MVDGNTSPFEPDVIFGNTRRAPCLLFMLVNKHFGTCRPPAVVIHAVSEDGRQRAFSAVNVATYCYSQFEMLSWNSTAQQEILTLLPILRRGSVDSPNRALQFVGKAPQQCNGIRKVAHRCRQRPKNFALAGVQGACYALTSERKRNAVNSHGTFHGQPLGDRSDNSLLIVVQGVFSSLRIQCLERNAGQRCAECLQRGKACLRLGCCSVEENCQHNPSVRTQVALTLAQLVEKLVLRVHRNFHAVFERLQRIRGPFHKILDGRAADNQ